MLPTVEYGGWLSQVREQPTFDPSLNLQRESVYLKTVELPSFRTWRSTDSIVLGRFLTPTREVYLSRARKLGVPVLHRSSGGGAVFHDLGNINYSIYVPQGFATGYGIARSLRAFSFPITGLLDSLGVPWSWEPPNNVYAMGRKISGSAQARSGGRLLHHGTLLVESDLNRMTQLLKPGGRSNMAPLVNLSEIVSGVTVEEITEALEAELRCCGCPCPAL
ncbi:MAG TPA: lipoate--protein ligase family protein [Candidatus Anoxymicrobiaceae bacterium]